MVVGGTIHIYYYTPLPLDLANKHQQHVTILFLPLHLPIALSLTLP